MKRIKTFKRKTHRLGDNLKAISLAILIGSSIGNIEAKNEIQKTVFSLSIENKKLSEALNIIQKETGYIFFYQYEALDKQKNVNLDIKNSSIEKTLDILFSNTKNTYVIDGRQVFIKEKVNTSNIINAPQQKNNKISIKGKVLDAQGVPIIGASVIEKGTINGTVTNEDGVFSLPSVTPNSTIIISFVGFTPQNIIAKENQTYNIQLKEDPKLMEEVVVIGYGTQRRSLVTSAISKLNVDESNSRQVVSPSQLLDGRIAGVTTSTGSGNLGSGERMSIRGISSLSASNEPLYVIDGIPIVNQSANLFNFGESMSSLATLNISDIESIEVLKDAASAAIYGSRGTNGVIVITTKSGKEGKSDIRLNVTTGFSKFPNMGKVKMADSDLYIRDYNEGVTNYNKQYGYKIGDSGYKIPISNPFGNLPDTDWMDVITQTGSFYNIDGSFSGGNKKTNFYIGTNYSNHEGIIKTNKMEKFNLKAKVNHQLTSWFEVGTNNSANYMKNYQVPGADLGTTIIGRALLQRPFDRPYKPNGDYYLGGTDELTFHNPLQILNEQDSYLENIRYIGNVYGMLKYKDKLSWKYSFNADVSHVFDYTYYNEIHPYGMGFGRLLDRTRLSKSYISENVINYNEKIKDFSLNAMLGHSFQKVVTTTTYIDARNFPSPSFTVASAAAETTSSSGKGIYAMESYFGRATLAFKDRYILTGTLRTDGSSRFARENRWGWFPSLSLGWNVSNEPFMEGRDTELKFRTSFGKTGNQEGIGSYAYQALMSGGRGYGQQSGIAVTDFGNELLTWEKADQFDVGFDLTLLKGKVNVMLDLYQKNTKDLLYNMPVHATTGVTSIYSNIGSMRNRGAEFTLNTHFNFGQFTWMSQFNISTNKNEITGLIGDDAPISVGGNRVLQVGKEMGAYYLFEKEGIYQYDGEVPKSQYDIGIRAGDIKWRDVDGNGIINDNDRVVMGSPNPAFSGGWNNTFKYKGFQLDVFFSYMYDFDVYAQWKIDVAKLGHRNAVLAEHAENRWTGPGSTNKYPRAMNGDANNSRNSDRWLEDGSFIRLRTLTFSYNFDKKLLEPIHLKGLRVFFQGDNLFLITKYSGWDPQVGNDLDPRFTSVDKFNVPQPRTFTFGANISF